MRLKNMLVDNSRRPIEDEDGNGMSHQFDMAHEDSGGWISKFTIGQNMKIIVLFFASCKSQ